MTNPVASFTRGYRRLDASFGGAPNPVIARSEATKQSILSFRDTMDCVAEPVIGRASLARNDDFLHSPELYPVSTALRPTANLSNWINAIWVVQSPSQKYSLFTRDPNHLHIPRRPGPREGRFAIVTNVGHGMRWTRTRRSANILRGRTALTRTAKSYGPDASTLASSSREAKLLGDDGDKKARSPGRVRRKPLKPFACGNAG